MKMDLEESDLAVARKRPPDENITELMTWARAKLGLGADRQWRLISSRTKLKKIFFEVEETAPEGTAHLIGKVSRSDRSKAAFESLMTVREAGFQPPSLYTVVRPVAYLEERKLLLQEKATGRQLLDLIRMGHEMAEEMSCRAARWLCALHGASIAALPFDGEPTIVERCDVEVPAELPQLKSRTSEISDCMLRKFAERGSADWVPSHGDFHPMNVFLADDGRVTVIDFDTFSARERASDVGYFLAQCAIMGYLDKGTFETTSQIRTAFLGEYQRVVRCEFDKARLGLYIAFAFLQSLHFERCILHTGNSSIVDPWLRSAERCLDGDIEL